MKVPSVCALLLLLAGRTAAAQSATPASQTSAAPSTPAQSTAQSQQPEPTAIPATDPQRAGAEPTGYPQPGYAPYLYPATRRRTPRVIDYRGGSVPVGMHLETRRNHALLAGGLIAFGLSYVSSAATSAVCSGGTNCSQGLGWLVVPVAGPFIALGYPQQNSVELALVADGVLQIAGFALFVGSFFVVHNVLVEDAYATRTIDWTVAPYLSSTGAGVSVLLRSRGLVF